MYAAVKIQHVGTAKPILLGFEYLYLAEALE